MTRSIPNVSCVLRRRILLVMIAHPCIGMRRSKATCCSFMVWRTIMCISKIQQNCLRPLCRMATSSTCRSIRTATIASMAEKPAATSSQESRIFWIAICRNERISAFINILFSPFLRLECWYDGLFPLFSKKVREKFCQYLKSPYLCTRFPKGRPKERDL